jgi:SulP family sulfate permease
MEIKRHHEASEFRRDLSLPPASIVQRLLPILGWLPGYRRDWVLPDVLAGLAVWAVMVPEGMAYAGIVGVPPIMGLYTLVPPLIAYALLGTSRLLVVGPDTATGLISALTVGAMAAQGTAEFNALTSTLAILIGAFFLLFGALRMGWVAAFIPTPVMRGFIEGLVCVTIIGQVPHLMGVEGPTPTRPGDTAGADTRRARHRAGRLCRSARRGEGRSNAGRRRHRS